MTQRLTSEAAARIAREAGLGMPDAAALMQLADTEEEAKALAAKFAPDVDVDAAYEAARIRGGMR